MSNDEFRLALANAIGGTNPKTGHVYIDGNDACEAVADRLISLGLVANDGSPDTEQARVELHQRANQVPQRGRRVS